MQVVVPPAQAIHKQEVRMTDSGSVANSYVMALVTTVEKLGISREDLFRDSDIVVDNLSDANGRTDINQLTLLWQRAVTLTGNPALGLEIGRSLSFGVFNVLATLLHNSATIKEAIEQVVCYQRLISDGGDFRLVVGDQLSQLIYTPHQHDIRLSAFQVEGVMASVFSFAATIAESGIQAEQVSFCHPQAVIDHDRYQQFFACPVMFDQPDNSIVFASPLLAVKIPNADEDIFWHNKALADKKIARLEGDVKVPVAQQLAINILNYSDFTDVTPERMAAELHLSVRSMQRVLAESQLSYSAILEQCRKDRVTELLSVKGPQALVVEDIARQLGYDNISSFYRAFKRWYGKTPGQFRSQS